MALDVRPSICVRRRRIVPFRIQLRSKVRPHSCFVPTTTVFPHHPFCFYSLTHLSPLLRQERGYHILLGLLITLVGLIITVTAPTHGSKYAGLCILTFGSYVSAPLTVAWLSGNTPEPGKRALVLGVNGFGNLSGVIGSQLFRPEYSPDYLMCVSSPTPPFIVSVAFVLSFFLSYLLTSICFWGDLDRSTSRSPSSRLRWRDTSRTASRWCTSIAGGERDWRR